MISPETLASPSIDPAFQAVLIGGGQPQPPKSGEGSWPATDELLDKSLEMAGNSRPNVLLVTSARWASRQSVEYLVAGYTNYYQNRGATTAVLHPYLYPTERITDGTSLAESPIDLAKVPSQAELTERTEAADVVFVLGGDTHRLLNQVWRPLGIDHLLESAMRRGAIISGVSAGAIAWFKGVQTASSSSRSDESIRDYDGFQYIDALGWIANTICGAHYDQLYKGHPRQTSFHNMMQDRRALGELGLGIDNDAALQITAGGVARVLQSPAGNGNKQIHAVTYRGDNAQTTVLDPASGTFNLSDLAL